MVGRTKLGGLVAIGGISVAAVVGAVLGTYLADRDEPEAAPRAEPTVTASRTPSAADPVASLAPSAAEPRSSVAPSSAAAGGNRTYPIGRVIHSEESATVTLVSAEVNGDAMRLNFRYRNNSAGVWELSCPAVSLDAEFAYLALPDGRVVRTTSTWCGTTRPGESFSLRPGEQLDSWGVFASTPPVGSTFSLSWYGYTVHDLRLG
ncbi:hypothetical protein O7606_26025 [Micromonospora sp. WMMD882]|uniref:hypothetical protein n=1 Tax=Micromonospora sp. WMMD882 TaxID=3015151 RepID=UPI00248D0DD1|nr:hypothetical protein [Micromonospora sp. WMMD882]WBB79566.1 hypothetical protein O7606_26025 [Micromonospora sp. WMMD882]